MIRLKLFATSTVLLAALAVTRGAEAQPSHPRGAADSVRVVRVVEQFHASLAAGDSVAAAALLDSAVVVLESGDFETRADYLRHHLPADIAFARAVRGTRELRRATLSGNNAWVVSTSRTAGAFEGRAVDSEGAELMVLTRSPDGWRIAAIHWSSHRRR
jgi:hypothetical protein